MRRLQSSPSRRARRRWPAGRSCRSSRSSRRAAWSARPSTSPPRWPPRARPLVATTGGRLVAELQAKGGIWIPFPAATKNPLAMLANVARLKSLCREEGVDLLHARSRAPAWSALAAARGLRIPFVTTYHGSYAGRSAVKVLYNSVMARGDVVIANSHYTADLIARKHPFARDHVRVIHRGTDLREFSPRAVEPDRVERLRTEWGVEPHKRIVLLAARLTGWKGQTVLIEATRRLVDRGHDDIAVVLAGDPQGREGYVRELDALVARLGLQHVVRRVGHCTDMPAAFLAASVVTVPSTEPEAFGRSAVEAQAMGAPVVVSDLGAGPRRCWRRRRCRHRYRLPRAGRRRRRAGGSRRPGAAASPPTMRCARAPGLCTRQLLARDVPGETLRLSRCGRARAGRAATQ